MADLKILAIVCVRNEELHIGRCLTDFITHGIDVFLLDNDSTDATRDIARGFLGRGLIAIERMPWTGAFSLSQQLAAKRKVANAVDCDWVIHADADEWLCAPQGDQSLAHGIAAADRSGANCINFHELVFVPVGNENFERPDYSSLMSTYYFFQPEYPRLIRAWKKADGFDNRRSGGHLLDGAQMRLHSVDFLLRHYIALSEGHAREKYLHRSYAEADLAKGWHRNRLAITADKLRVKMVAGLRSLPSPRSNELDLCMPLATHFWEW